MALRVLLADESTTIKRVMQLALQDFAVEVKAVPIGIDVLPVTKAFKPDIIFVDVLLPKKSGYEVGKELKKDTETKNIPLVLMWSGFMELDEAKAKESLADRRIEKPFEPDTLRSLVKDLVKKTQSNPVSSYLSFPEMPDFKEEAPPVNSNHISGSKSAPNTDLTNLTGSHIFSLDPNKNSLPEEIPTLELPDDEEFAQVPLHKSALTQAKESSSSEDWAHQDLSKFKINIPSDEKPELAAQQFSIPSSEEEQPQVNSFGDFEEVTFAKAPTQGPTQETKSGSFPTSGMIDHELLVREEARKIIESIAWKILPAITERIVREEINKLLQDTEKSISVP